MSIAVHIAYSIAPVATPHAL